MFDRIRLQFLEYFYIHYLFTTILLQWLEPDIFIFTEEITDSNNSLVMEVGLDPRSPDV